MKKILLTGANGLLGGKIIRLLHKEPKYEIVAVASSEEKLRVRLAAEEIVLGERIHYLSNQEFLSSETTLSDVYGAIHLAFARRIRPAEEIASSIEYASAVFKKLAQWNINRIINVSSQGIYGNVEEIRTEKTLPAPANHYTMAKYATEIIFNLFFDSSSVLNYTNVRLDLVIQSQNLVPALCRQAKGGKIQLKGGEQRFSFIDIEDAAAGIVAMLNSKDGWDKIYNLGWNKKRIKLIEIAGIVADIAVKFGYARPEIMLDKQDISLWAGMDSSRFIEHTGWHPKINIYDMIEQIFRSIECE